MKIKKLAIHCLYLRRPFNIGQFSKFSLYRFIFSSQFGVCENLTDLSFYIAYVQVFPTSLYPIKFFAFSVREMI